MHTDAVQPIQPARALSALAVKPRRPTRSLPPAPIDVQSLPIPDDPSQVVESPKEENSQQASLTPLRAHYLKKTLLNLEFRRELTGIATASPVPNVSTLSYLGPPFSTPPKGAPPLDLPFLRYIFQQYILTFPFLRDAPKNFYADKLQPFIASLLARNLTATSVLDTGSENSEEASRLKILAKMEKQLSLVLGSATKLVEPEEVVRLSQTDLDRLEALARRRTARERKTKEVFEVNVVCVRVVHDRGRVRSRVHEEFIIRTRRTHQKDIFVSRRYGDFKTLANELRKMHPEELARPPPAKDRKAGTSGVALSPSPSHSSGFPNDSSESLPTSPLQPAPAYRLARERNRLTLRAYLHSLMTSATLASSPVLRSFLISNPTQLSPEEQEDAARREEADMKREEGRIHFAREIASRVEGLRNAVKSVKGDIMAKDGLTRIFATIKVTSNVNDLPPEYLDVLEWARVSLASTIFQHFIASDASSENLAGLKRIHGLVPYFLLKGALRISNPVAMIRGVMDLFLSQPFGGKSLLQRMFSSSLQEEAKNLEEDIEAVKDKVEDPVMCEKVRQFVYAPPEIQSIYRTDAAAENINLLTVILRSGEEPSLTRQQMFRVNRAHRAHLAYTKHREDLDDSDDDDGPQDSDAWLYEDLSILAKLYSQLRDKEQLIDLIFEGNTADLLKDIITIFYAPLAQVYKAASIADSLGDLQTFISDLIRTVEQAEEVGPDDPNRVVQMFIELVQRHEQAFYNFVHKVHSKGEGLFDALMRWIELFITAIREGLGEKVALEFILPHTGEERLNIMKEVDAVALYHYKLKLAHEDKIRRRFGKVQGQQGADAEDEAAQLLVDGIVRDLSFGDLVQGDADDLAAEETDESDDDDSEDDSSSEETSSGSEETSTDESAETPGPSTATMTRARTVGHSAAGLPRNPYPQRIAPSASVGQRVPSRSKSMMLSEQHSRHSVNSLSSKTSFDSHDKPLPRIPPPSAVPPPPPPKESNNKNKSRSAKKAAEIIKPPELKHIPELLPLFVEILRPLLRSRPI